MAGKMKSKKMVSDSDRAVLKAAMKVLKRLARRELVMDAEEDAAVIDLSKDYNAIAEKHWKFLDELESLGVFPRSVSLDGLKLIAELPKHD